MPRTREHSHPTRQIYASIREDVYLAAKARAAELRLPLRRFIEEALANAVGDGAGSLSEGKVMPPSRSTRPYIWDDQYIGAQASQPLGAPLDLSESEARRVAMEGFRFGADSDGASHPTAPANDNIPTSGEVGDPVDLSDEDAAQVARKSLLLGLPRQEGSYDG